MQIIDGGASLENTVCDIMSYTAVVHILVVCVRMNALGISVSVSVYRQRWGGYISYTN